MVCIGQCVFPPKHFDVQEIKNNPFLVTVSFLVSMKGSSLGTVSPYVVYNLKSIGKHLLFETLGVSISDHG